MLKQDTVYKHMTLDTFPAVKQRESKNNNMAVSSIEKQWGIKPLLVTPTMGGKKGENIKPAHL